MDNDPSRIEPAPTGPDTKLAGPRFPRFTYRLPWQRPSQGAPSQVAVEPAPVVPKDDTGRSLVSDPVAAAPVPTPLSSAASAAEEDDALLDPLALAWGRAADPDRLAAGMEFVRAALAIDRRAVRCPPSTADANAYDTRRLCAMLRQPVDTPGGRGWLETVRDDGARVAPESDPRKMAVFPPASVAAVGQVSPLDAGVRDGAPLTRPVDAETLRPAEIFLAQARPDAALPLLTLPGAPLPWVERRCLSCGMPLVPPSLYRCPACLEPVRLVSDLAGRWWGQMVARQAADAAADFRTSGG